MDFRPGVIEGVIWRPLQKYRDARGWLCELFRQDELPAELCPAMAYLSATEPGVARGPHEHEQQTDYFCFLGPSNFKVFLWDNRPHSSTHGIAETRVVGLDCPMMLIIPPGVVHAYRNIGTDVGVVFNAPNRLYKGQGRQEPVDEIRHEDDPQSPFQLEVE